MTREHAADYLASILASLLTDAGLEAVDEPGALGEVIDDALLMVGVAYDDLATATVASADALGFRLVLEFAGLKRIYNAILNRVDIQMDGPQMSKSRSQYVRQMENRIKQARDAAEPFIAVSGQWGTGTISFDYLEPVTT